LVPLLALLFTFSLPRLPNTPLLIRPVVPVHKLEHNSLFNHYHLRLALPKTMPKPWLYFLGLWFIAEFGATLVFAFYPLLMKAYGVPTDLAAWGFAVAVAFSLVLYAPVGRFVTKLGAGHMLFLGYCLRAFSLAGLFSVSLLPLPFHIPVALISFALAVLTWSLLSVAGTTLAADSSLPEGEAMGIFSAVSALAGVLGSLTGGLVAHWFGYTSLPLTACLALTLCAALVSFLKRAGSETVLK
jgi:MFS family permease